jgi:multiple sugar transport system permease protein
MSIWPLFSILYTSLHRFNLFMPHLQTFLGLGNYSKLLWGDQTFWYSVKVTFLLMVTAIALQFFFGAVLAILMDRHTWGESLIRVLLMSPVLLSPIAMGLMWRYMYEPEIGVINYLFRLLGLAPRNWLSDPQTALWAVVAVAVWQWTPFVFLVLLAGLQNIPQELKEAAQIDGASERKVLWFIALPLLKPIILIILLFRMMDTMKDFALVYITTYGGPGIATYVLPFYAWIQGFYKWEMGYASAAAVLIVLFINVLVVLTLRQMRTQIVLEQGE